MPLWNANHIEISCHVGITQCLHKTGECCARYLYSEWERSNVHQNELLAYHVFQPVHYNHLPSSQCRSLCSSEQNESVAELVCLYSSAIVCLTTYPNDERHCSTHPWSLMALYWGRFSPVLHHWPAARSASTPEVRIKYLEAQLVKLYYPNTEFTFHRRSTHQMLMSLVSPLSTPADQPAWEYARSRGCDSESGDA